MLLPLQAFCLFLLLLRDKSKIFLAQGSMPQDDVSRALIYTTYTDIWSPLDSSELTGRVWDSFPFLFRFNLVSLFWMFLLRECIECRLFNTGRLADNQTCQRMCKDKIITVETLSECTLDTLSDASLSLHLSTLHKHMSPLIQIHMWFV